MVFIILHQRKLIQFGLLKNILRRVKKYPIKLAQSEDVIHKQDTLYDWFDGGHSFDEICSQTGMPVLGFKFHSSRS